MQTLFKSIYIMFFVVLLAKESLMAKPSICVTGASQYVWIQGGEEFVPFFCSCTDDIIKDSH